MEPRSIEEIEQYALDALGVIRDRALFSADVDWDAVYAEARETAGNARSYAGTHRLLHRTLRQAGGRHSHLVPPYPIPGRPQPPETEPKLPEGRRSGAVGVISLPELPRRLRQPHDYVTAGERLISELARDRPRGWVVDLRDNNGGNMWPMLAAVAGLLDPGVLGYMDRPGATPVPWQLNQRSVSLGRRALARCQARRVRRDGMPLAVLISERTASSGEAVLIALRSRPPVRTFGTATAGLTTSNGTHALRDGTRLIISRGYMADVAGRRIDGPIQPDELVADEDDPLAAAAEWISGQ
jgi:carboxyl-terminal processing protease